MLMLYAQKKFGSSICTKVSMASKTGLKYAMTSGVTMGGKGGYLSPGATIWGRQIEV